MSHDATGPPSDITGRWARNLWRKTRKQLQEQGTWQDSDVPALERYIRVLLMAKEAREQVDGKLVVRGSKEQDVAHPLLKVLRDAETDAHKYAEALLLTPAARKRAEIRPRPKKGKLGL